MPTNVPKRIATTVINSLKGGVVPRRGLEYIAVGRKYEIEALLQDTEIIQSGGATMRFIVGKYGSGKSFLLQLMRNYCLDKGFVVMDADLSPERRLLGNKKQGLATYKELINNISTKTQPDGGALGLILEKWISNLKTEIITELGSEIDDNMINKELSKKIFQVVDSVEGMVNGYDFGRLINIYFHAVNQGDDDTKSKVIRWFKGEYSTKTEARADLGVGIIIEDSNWYEYIKLFSTFFVKAGYSGLLIIVDELVNLFKIPHSISRNNNYEKLLTIYNDVLQGKARNIGFIFGGTPQSIEDSHKGVFSYEALRSRLQEGRFAKDEYKDYLAPILRLSQLTHEELFVLIEKIADIHAELYGYGKKISSQELEKFLNIEFSRVGADVNITPREIIRDFIELLNISYQNDGVTISQIFGENSFEFSKSLYTEESIHEEFADFEV